MKQPLRSIEQNAAGALLVLKKKRSASKEIKYLRRVHPELFTGRRSRSKAECLADAKKYKTRKEWQVKSGAISKYAQTKGWYEECCAHMKLAYIPQSYWNKAKCKAEACKFTLKRDWREKSSSSYLWAKENGYIKEFSKNMETHRNRYWTKERVIADALKYSTRREWYNNNNSAYNAAKLKGWRKECYAHMKLGCKPVNYWNNKKRCIKEARKYKSKSDWANGNSTSYGVSKRKGWFKDCTAHMKHTIHPSGYWTKERCIAAAKKYKTNAGWYKNSKSSYGAARANGWLEECRAHPIKIRRPNGYWTKKNCIANAKEYKTRTEWLKKGSRSAYTEAQKNGWLGDCCKHMIHLKNPSNFWTKNRVITEARKYKTVTEWSRKNSSSYKKARDNKWLKECRSHMKELRKPPGYWTKELIIKESLKYKTKKEWKKKSQFTLARARKMGWLNEIWSHHNPMLLEKPL